MLIEKTHHILLKIRAYRRFVTNLLNNKKFNSNKTLFLNMGGEIEKLHKITYDFYDKAGTTSGHYFHQDLLVAQFIYHKKPLRHIDIGSRLDGFVAHVASFREIEVMDVRDMDATAHKNISFVKLDLMDEKNSLVNLADSISCLHAIEHFGLGRYGDPIDPIGYKRGFLNIVRMLKTSGNLYISFPIGKSNQVHFNAHRVFEPKDIFSWIENKQMLVLERFDYVDDTGDLHLNVNLENTLINVNYGCGVYTFLKL